MHEHDDEPVPGLPQTLPEGEKILWQGRSAFRSLAVSTLHLRKLAIYFAVLLVLRVGIQLNEGVQVLALLKSTAVLALLAVTAIGLLAYYAYKAAAASMFTITNRRIVMRCGVAVSVTINLPYAVVEAAELRLHNDGSGDIAVQTDRSARASYILLWPMLKPFRFMNVTPVLRGLDDAESAANILSEALGSYAADAGEQSRVKEARQAEKARASERPERGFRPHYPLAAASTLVVVSIVAVSMYQLFGKDTGGVLLEPATATVELWFEDRENGAVAVIDAETGDLLDTLPPTTNGFVRGALRSLARERRASGIGDEEPFAIRLTTSGRVVLHDTATDRVIDLRAFGATNEEAFARFLTIKQDDQAAEASRADSTATEDGVTAMALTQRETRK